jgi:hypothetical protein
MNLQFKKEKYLALFSYISLVHIRIRNIQIYHWICETTCRVLQIYIVIDILGT